MVTILTASRSIVWDFDGTITPDGGYSEDIPPPRPEIVALMRRAHDLGLKNVIASCRWSVHELNDAAGAERNMVAAQAYLEEWDIPYDELRQKPLGEFYCDDKAIHADDLAGIESAIAKAKLALVMDENPQLDPLFEAMGFKASGDLHPWGCLMVDFPDDMAQKAMAWAQANVPDDVLYTDPEDPTGFGRETHIHTTVAYGLDPKMDRQKIADVVAGIAKPIKVRLGRISKFEPEDYDVIKVEVESDDLHALHDVVKALGVPGETYPDYKPHLTLAYVQKGSCDDLLGQAPFEGEEFELSRFDYSAPPEPGQKDKHTKYEVGTTVKAATATPVRPQTETPEFKAWFSGSKVVDADGKPLMVFHGTSGDFNEFKVPAFFTADAKAAESYAVEERSGKEKNPNVKPVYLSIKNPATDDDVVKAVKDLRLELRSDITHYFSYEFLTPAQFEYASLVIQKLESEGFDGAVLMDYAMGGIDEITSYCVFHPSQIKSATGNRGTFDPEAGDITAEFEDEGRNEDGYWGESASGILYRSADGKILLLKRSSEVDEPGTWGIPGGAIPVDDATGKPKDALASALTEAGEEMGGRPEASISGSSVFRDGDFTFTTFYGLTTDTSFKPTNLGWESTDWGWFGVDELPSPLHPGVSKTLGGVKGGAGIREFDSNFNKLMKYFLENEELWNEAQKTKDASQFYKLLEKKGLSLIDHVNPDQLFSWIKAALSPELARAAVGEALGEASVSAWETVGLGVFQTDKMTDILDRTIEKLGRWGAFEAYAKDNFGVPLRGHRVFAEAVEFVDRYQALGIPYPDPETMCHGQCEGTGFIPVNFREPGPGDCYHVYSDEKDALYRPLWEAAEAESPSDDGYQFIKCPDCHGSGKIVASKLSVPKGVAKNVRGFDGTLANVKSWQAKIVLGNNLGKDKKKGGWDTVGYVMVNPTTGVVVPVACGDEHQTGTELLYHYQDLGYLNANGFVPMTTGFNYFDMSDPTFLKVIKFWLDNGGPDGHVHDSRTREAGLMSEWLAGAGKRIVEPGKLAAGGQAWIEALEDFSKAWAKLPADREPDEGLVKNLFDAAYAVRQIAYDWHFMWGSPGDVIDRLFTAQDYKGLGDVVLGMSGTKNKVHGKLKELIADPNDYETQDFKNFFGDLGVAKAELDRLGGIKAASANIKFWIDPSRNFHGFGGAAHYLDNVAHIDWLKQNNIEYTETDDSAFGELPAKGWVRGYVQDGSLSLTIDPGVVKVENVLEDVPQEYRFVDDIFVEGVLNADGFAENLGQAIVLDGEDALDAWKHRNDVRHRVEAVKAVDPVTETPEFKAWFAGSQVVDKTGAPQLVNHGTDVVGIEKFHGDTGDVVPGLMYFSDKIGVARSYGSVLYQCYLKMTSPLVEDLGGASYGEVLPSAYAVQARDNGYDGVILTNIKDDVGSMKNGTNYMVWNPDQIWKVSEKQRGSSQSLRPAMTLKERQKLVKDKLDADELAQETSMREHDAWVNSPAADQWKKDRAKVAKANKAKKAVTASIVAHVRKRGSKWVVTNKAGTKTLGTHDSKESADKQLAAIEIAKHAHGSLRAENKFDRLYREAVDVSQNDAKYSGALENPSLAQEMGQFQQAVKDSRSEEELQQAWSRFQPSVTWEALTALAGHESQEPTTV